MAKPQCVRKHSNALKKNHMTIVLQPKFSRADGRLIIGWRQWLSGSSGSGGCHIQYQDLKNISKLQVGNVYREPFQMKNRYHLSIYKHDNYIFFLIILHIRLCNNATTTLVTYIANHAYCQEIVWQLLRQLYICSA